MPRPPRPDKPVRSTGAAAPWAAGEAQAAPAPLPAAPEASQRPLLPGDAPAVPHVRRARLRSRIKALLTARLKRKAEPPAGGGGSSGSSWPDSFFGP
jgi:hypothetical protein